MIRVHEYLNPALGESGAEKCHFSFILTRQAYPSALEELYYLVPVKSPNTPEREV